MLSLFGRCSLVLPLALLTFRPATCSFISFLLPSLVSFFLSSSSSFVLLLFFLLSRSTGVWDPPFEPNNSVLQNLVTPLGTSIVGTFGADQNYNHTTMSLASSKCNSVMMLSPNFNTSKGIEKQTTCQQLKTSYDNALWRWQQYGKSKGCPEPPQPNTKALAC